SPSPPAAFSSSGHSVRSAGSGASHSSSRRADCGVCDGASRGNPCSYQSTDLGDGVVTPGGKTPHHVHDELRRLRLPEMARKSVLDIGAWDGFYTFHAE